MKLIDEKLQQYCEDHSGKESDLLSELNRDTHVNVLIPQMLSGRLQGRFLSMISKMVKPKNILEIGTYTGYSALCLAEGLQAGGALHTLEKNEELESFAKKYFNQSEYKDKIHFHLGDASKIIPTLDVEFDLVFIDADKPNYSNYYDLVIDKLPSGAVILADNVLWWGKVAGDLTHADEDTKALHQFNEKVNADARVENVLNPIRDGILMIRKL
jgi:predicted O-methyltransferase YrrM